MGSTIYRHWTVAYRVQVTNRTPTIVRFTVLSSPHGRHDGERWAVAAGEFDRCFFPEVDDLMALAEAVGVVRQPEPRVPSQRPPAPIHPGLRATLSDESLAVVLDQWSTGGDAA